MKKDRSVKKGERIFCEVTKVADRTKSFSNAWEDDCDHHEWDACSPEDTGNNEEEDK